MRTFVLSCVCVLAPLAGQTFVVDAAGGPGSQFTSLPAAVAAVPDGATLIVRPGYYAPFVIDNKSLTVLGDAGAVVRGLPPRSAVRNLAPFRRVTLRGLWLEIGFDPVPLELTSCAGTVLLERCIAANTAALLGSALNVDNCADVRMVDCRFEQSWPNSRALWCRDSSLTASRSLFVNHGAGPGIHFYGHDLELADCGVSGRGSYQPWAAVYMLYGSVRVLGTTLLTTSLGGPVLTGNGDARIAPSATLATGTGPAVVLNGVVVYQPMPVLAAATGPLGSFAGASLTGAPGDLGGLFVGFAGLPATVPPFVDAMRLQPGSAIAMAFGSLASPVVAAYAVPSLPAVLGVVVAWQGVSVGSTWQLSNCVSYAHW